MLDQLHHWALLHPLYMRLFTYLAWICLVLIAVGLVRLLLMKTIRNRTLKYKTQKSFEILGYLIIVVITILYFTGNIKDFGLSIGLLSAGIAITLQEIILSIAGSLYILFAKIYRPGDRIQINGIKGDVIDIDSVYTTMMEVGEWITSDNYSGRIVKLSNSFVFKGPVFNYSQDFPFLWDEFNLPVRYGSDVELAKGIMIEVAQENLSSYAIDSAEEWKQMVDKYYVEDALVEPSLAITLTDNWIQFNLRYIVDYKKRRLTKDLLNQEIGKRILATDGRVILASSTVEIIKISTERHLKPQ